MLRKIKRKIKYIGTYDMNQIIIGFINESIDFFFPDNKKLLNFKRPLNLNYLFLNIEVIFQL